MFIKFGHSQLQNRKLVSETSGFFFLRFYLFIFRERGREGEREEEKHPHERETLPLTHFPNQGPNLQPRHVP